MLKFWIKTEDLSNLGYPQDMIKEAYIKYYHWTKEGNNPLEFNCTIERSLEYVENFINEHIEVNSST